MSAIRDTILNNYFEAYVAPKLLGTILIRKASSATLINPLSN